MWVPSGADDYTTEEWGFGVRAAMRGDKVGFENYDFGRKGNLKETWPLVAMAQEALKTFMDKVEMYTVHIEVPEV